MSVFCTYYFQNKNNGKMYIGKANNFDYRIKEHIRSSNIDSPKYPIHKAIKKYGIDNFETNIIQIYDTEWEALLAEMYWIQHLKIQGISLYNLTNGGDGISGYHHSDELKKHWSETRKGKMAGENHPLYGKPRSDDMKRKSRDKQLGRKVPQDIVDKIASKNTGKNRSPQIVEFMSISRMGDGNPNSKLDWEKVYRIRKLLETGEMTQNEIAKMFNIARTIVSRIKNNKIWKI